MKIGLVDCCSLVSLSIINKISQIHKVFGISSYYFSMGFFSKNLYKPIKVSYSGYHYFSKGKWKNDIKKEKNYIKEIRFIVEKYKIDAILPLSETEIIPLSKNSDKIKTKLLITTKDNIYLFHNKIIFIENFSDKFNIPISFYPNSTLDIKKVLKELSFPVVLKPNFTPWNIKVILCNNEEEVKKGFYKIKKSGNIPIIQEFIDGFPVVCEIVCDTTKKPKIFSTYSLPVKRWSKEKISVEKVKKYIKLVEKISCKLFKKVKWIGIASVQFLIKENKPYIIEVNPRSSAFGISYFLYKNFPFYMIDCFYEKMKKEKRSIILSEEMLKKLEEYLFNKEIKSLKLKPFSSIFFKFKSTLF